MGANRTPWVSRIQNPCYMEMGDQVLGKECWSGHIPNPIAPSYCEVEHTYTRSEFPPELNAAIVEKIKALKRQKMIDDGTDLDHAFEAIGSINQLWIGKHTPEHEPGPLDDIKVKLPLMLDWLDECGWGIVSGDGKTIVLKKRPHTV